MSLMGGFRDCRNCQRRLMSFVIMCHQIPDRRNTIRYLNHSCFAIVSTSSVGRYLIAYYDFLLRAPNPNYIRLAYLYRSFSATSQDPHDHHKSIPCLHTGIRALVTVKFESIACNVLIFSAL